MSKKPKRSKLEAEFEAQLEKGGWTPGMVIEHQFHPTRRWRFDVCWPAYRVAVEVMGGLWVRGAHARPQGLQNDMIKAREAALLGWTVIAGTGQCIKNGELYDVTTRLLEQRGYRFGKKKDD